MSSPTRGWERESVVLQREPPPLVIRGAALLVLLAAAAFAAAIFLVPLPRRADGAFEVVERDDGERRGEVLLPGVTSAEVPERGRVRVRLENNPAARDREAVVVEARDTDEGSVVAFTMPSAPAGATRSQGAMRGMASVDLRRRPLVVGPSVGRAP